MAGERVLPDEMTTEQLREKARGLAPNLSAAADGLSVHWSACILEALRALEGKRTANPKTFADPILGPIDLFEWELLLLDSPFLQRLRGVRQLGMVHAVYPGAVHDRFTHSIGVVEIADRMIEALSRNARYRRDFGDRSTPPPPLPNEGDRYTIRLAALLHDIGHGPFSHASEDLIQERHAEEFEALNDLFRGEFEGARGVKPSEAVAILLIISEPLQRVFQHSRFTVPITDRIRLQVSIVALILGSRGGGLEAPYLYELISGPIDADKLDYMARDSYFTGLPVGIDVNRLIKKLEIVRITPENAINAELRKRAEDEPEKAVFELGVSLSGLTAYEQMIVGRALLYDRVYYHHKVRCGEAMLRKLIRTAELERGKPYTVEELFSEISDDAMIHVLGGKMNVGEMTGGSVASEKLASQIRTRMLFHRAFAFASRFFAGLEGLEKSEKRDTLASLWDEILQVLSGPAARAELERQIVTTANELLDKVPAIPADTRLIEEADVIVDLPEDRVTAGSRTLPMRTEGGRISSANLFFDPGKWSEAFKSQKQCGFVFARRGIKEVVWLASQIVFFERFGAVMSEDAHHFCKTDALLGHWAGKWISAAQAADICSPECALAISQEKPKLIRLRVEDIQLPPEWIKEEPGLSKRLAQEFFNVLPGGLIASIHSSTTSAMKSLCQVASAFYSGGTFKANSRPDEVRDLQAAMLQSLRSAGIDAKEGAEMGGGESDILLPGEIIVENKVIGETSDPMSEKPEAGWQARRYSISMNRRISFVVIAYKPQTDAALLTLPESVKIEQLEGCPEPRAIVKICIPWGYETPSRAKRPN